MAAPDRAKDPNRRPFTQPLTKEEEDMSEDLAAKADMEREK